MNEQKSEFFLCKVINFDREKNIDDIIIQFIFCVLGFFWKCILGDVPLKIRWYHFIIVYLDNKSIYYDDKMKHIGNFVIIVIKVEVEQRGRESSGVLYYLDDKKGWNNAKVFGDDT